jgi:hypothetical protein
MSVTAAALPRPATNPFNEIVEALTLIRRKAGFLGAVLSSEIDLTDEGDLHELVCLTEQIYTAAEQALAHLVPEGNA